MISLKTEEIELFNHGEEFGVFKGLIRICKKDKLRKYEEVIQKVKSKGSHLLKDFKYYKRVNELSQKILVEREINVRIYVLELNNLAKKDLLSETDPYVVVKLGDKVHNDSKRFQVDKQSCGWYTCYEYIILI
jgi:hypothetical protein